jgi:hypothetical protein
MSGVLTINKTEQGWAATMPPDMAEAAGVEENSLVVLHLKDGQIEAEILPPVTPAMKRRAQRTLTKFQAAFDEMKRRGD